MTSLKLKLDSLVNLECVCRVCQNDFEPPNVDSIFCDSCERWFHLSCCGLSEHEFKYFVNMKILFIA